MGVRDELNGRPKLSELALAEQESNFRDNLRAEFIDPELASQDPRLRARQVAARIAPSLIGIGAEVIPIHVVELPDDTQITAQAGTQLIL